jgi:ABC-type Fe3+ transport system substrate-binding protein
MNPAFAGLDLFDPEGRYAVIAVVPAVFLVNTAVLGERPLPRTWAELLTPEYEHKVSLPVGDFDLFSGILLDLRRRFGDDGVRRLGRSLMESLHPAQMVKVGARPNPPTVTIMPNFFTKMARPGSTLQAVWPEDGAIISPVFLLAKDDARVQPLVDFFCSREVADILAEKGLFPSAHPDVVNDLPAGATFSWLGWQWISSVDVKAEIAACLALFEEGKAAR